ncbi:hypothetical protein [Aureivirga sp. CE67]|uniref:hypothetical protein n=1 Tax=Aureivirga sp. CE67 TaxID=1788983 RepID=UPI0018CA9F61|nr:hypothetical protein [Aureivirga sp. CE67]
MKNTILIILFLSIFSTIFSQEKNDNSILDLKNLQTNDTINLDLISLGCFGSNWDKIRIIKKENNYEFVKITNIIEVIVKKYKGKILNSELDIDKWIQENFSTLIEKKKHLSYISKQEFEIFIEKINHLNKIGANTKRITTDSSEMNIISNILTINYKYKEDIISFLEVL